MQFGGANMLLEGLFVAGLIMLNLKSYRAHENPEELMAVFYALKQMNVSAIDFQIRALSTESFLPFINMLIAVLEKRQDFELAHSYLATFLNIHREQLWSEAESEIKEESEEQNMEEHATTTNGNELTTVRISAHLIQIIKPC